MFDEYSGHEPGPTLVSYGGMSFISTLQLVFIILKLCGVITWSWWFVMMPMFGSTALMLAIAIIFLIVCLVVACKNKHRRRKFTKKLHDNDKSGLI